MDPVDRSRRRVYRIYMFDRSRHGSGFACQVCAARPNPPFDDRRNRSGASTRTLAHGPGSAAPTSFRRTHHRAPDVHRVSRIPRGLRDHVASYGRDSSPVSIVLSVFEIDDHLRIPPPVFGMKQTQLEKKEIYACFIEQTCSYNVFKRRGPRKNRNCTGPAFGVNRFVN